MMGDADAAQASPRVALIVPFFAGDRFLPELERGVRSAGAGLVHWILVDNSPRRSEAARVAVERAGGSYVRTRARIGYGRAINAGVARAAEAAVPYCVILNQDGRLLPGAAQELSAVAQAADCVAVAVEVDYETEAVTEHFAEWYLPQCRGASSDFAAGGTPARTYDSVMIHGFCFCASTALLRELGPFDPLFFMYGEDEDLSERVRARGNAIQLASNARVGHLNSIAHAAGASLWQIDTWRRHGWLVSRIKRREFPVWRVVAQALNGARRDVVGGRVGLRRAWRWGLDEAASACRLVQALFLRERPVRERASRRAARDRRAT